MSFIKKLLQNRKNHIPILLLLLLLGMVLRLYRLGFFSLWFDEALCAIQIASLRQIWQGTAMGSLPPLYYILLHFWSYIGENEFILRLLSTIFSLLSIYVIYAVGKVIVNKNMGLICALLLSISPLHIYYSQEVKMYTLFPLLTILSILFLIKILRADSLSLWILFIITTVLSLYTHYFALFNIFAENIFIFFFQKDNRKLIKKWFVAQCTIILLFLPWIHILISQHLEQTLTFTSEAMPKGDLKAVFMTFKNFTVGYHASKPVYLFAVPFFFLLFTCGIYSLKNSRRELYLLLCMTIIPIFITLLFSQKLNIYMDRFLISSSLTCYIIVACGIYYLRRQQLILITIISFLLISPLRNHYLNIFPTSKEAHFGAHHKINYRDATNFIIDNFREADIIIHSCLASYVPFEYYSQGKIENNFVVLKQKDVKSKLKKFWISKGSGKMLTNIDNIKQTIQVYRRIWLVLAQWHIDNIGNIPLEKRYPNRLTAELKNLLDNNCVMIAYKEFAGLRIYLYSRD